MQVEILILPHAADYAVLKRCQRGEIAGHLGGADVRALRSWVSSPPIDWQVFIRHDPQAARLQMNSLAHRLTSRLQCQPGKSFYGSVAFAGLRGSDGLVDLPGFVPQTLRHLGIPIRGEIGRY